MKKLFLVLFLLLLVGCNTKAPTKRLETPKNLSLNDFILSWDSVTGAVSYEVVINDVAYTVTVPSLDLREFEDGDYVARVKAIGTKVPESLYSEKFSFSFRESIRIPGNIKIVNDVLSWTLEQDAVKYVIKINGVEHETPKNTFNLSVLEANQFYEIQVKGVYRNLETKFSSPLVYHTFKSKYLTTEEVIFDKSSEEDFVMVFEKEFTIESIRYLDEDIEFAQEGLELRISATVFQDIPYGKNQFIAFTDKGLVEVLFKLTDSTKPFLKSQSTVKYVAGENITFEFELYSSKIGEINGSGITSSDYIVNDNLVIIRSQFLDQIFSNQERTNLILGYYLLINDNDVVIGYIMITRN